MKTEKGIANGRNFRRTEFSVRINEHDPGRFPLRRVLNRQNENPVFWRRPTPRLNGFQ